MPRQSQIIVRDPTVQGMMLQYIQSQGRIGAGTVQALGRQQTKLQMNLRRASNPAQQMGLSVQRLLMNTALRSQAAHVQAARREAGIVQKQYGAAAASAAALQKKIKKAQDIKRAMAIKEIMKNSYVKKTSSKVKNFVKTAITAGASPGNVAIMMQLGRKKKKK